MWIFRDRQLRRRTGARSLRCSRIRVEIVASRPSLGLVETISVAVVARRVDDLDHLLWTTHAVEVCEVGGVDAPVGQRSMPQPIQ